MEDPSLRDTIDVEQFKNSLTDTDWEFAPVVKVLFPTFPRDFGLPDRPPQLRVNSYRELGKRIAEFNGLGKWEYWRAGSNGKREKVNVDVGGCYCSIYAYGLRIDIDKLFYDIDIPLWMRGKVDAIEVTRGPTQKLYLWLVSHGFTVVAVFSGSKGFHIYVLLESETYDTDKEDEPKPLRDALIGAASYIVRAALTPEEIVYVDPSVLGDVKRISRIPNTLRPPKNEVYCIQLPHDWTLMTNCEIKILAKTPTYYEYDWTPKFKLSELPSAKSIKREKSERDATMAIPTKLDPLIKKTLRKFLPLHIRKNIATANPDRFTRRTGVRILLEHFKPDEVVKICSHLGWENFNFATTRQRVFSIAGENYVTLEKERKKMQK